MTSSTVTSAATVVETGSTTGPSNCHVDVLIVGDISESMNDYRDGVVATFLGVGTAIEDTLGALGSYNIGFTYNAPAVTNERHFPQDPAHECTALGSLLYGQDADCAATLGGRPYVTQDDNLANAVLCLADFNGAGRTELETPRPLDAILTALDGTAEPAETCNAGFHNPGDPLIVIAIGDAEDESMRVPAAAAGELVGIEGDLSLGGVAFLNVSADPAGCPSTAPSGCAAVPACRVQTFIDVGFGATMQLDNVRHYDICDLASGDPALTSEAVTAEFEALVQQICQP